MKWYPWLRPDFEQLVASYQSGRGHHALLIHALEGMGDDALIYAINRLLLCQTPQGNKSCGRCRGCELMQAGTHHGEDFFDRRIMTPAFCLRPFCHQ